MMLRIEHRYMNFDVSFWVTLRTCWLRNAKQKYYRLVRRPIQSKLHHVLRASNVHQCKVMMRPLQSLTCAPDVQHLFGCVHVGGQKNLFYKFLDRSHHMGSACFNFISFHFQVLHYTSLSHGRWFPCNSLRFTSPQIFSTRVELSKLSRSTLQYLHKKQESKHRAARL